MQPCPACNAPLGPLLYHSVADFEHGLPATADFQSCPGCGLLAQAPIPSPERLRDFYPTDYRPHATSSGGALAGGLVARLKDLQAAQLLRRFPPIPRGARVLELGCGSGHLLRRLQKSGAAELIGIDRNPRLADTFAGTGITFHASDLESDALPVEGPFDAIIMSFVLEHFHDPAAMLARCRDLLAPGGHVLLLTPSASSMCHAFFRSYWSGLHAPRHTLIFTPTSLRALSARLRFDQIDLSEMIDPAGWALSFQNWVQAQRGGSAPHAGTAWYSLASMPLWVPAAVLERAVGRGQSLVAALRR